MPITPVFREPDRPSTNCPVFRPFIRVPYSIFLYLSDSHSISRCLSVAFLQQATIYFIYATDFSGNRGENPCSGPGSPVTSVRILFDHISFLFLFLETNYPAFIVPRGFKCRNNREINDTHTNLTTSIYYSKPSSITSPVESKRTELRALR